MQPSVPGRKIQAAATILVLMLAGSALAQTRTDIRSKPQDEMTAPHNRISPRPAFVLPSQPPPFRDTHGTHAHYGGNGYPAAGYPHYDFRPQHYGLWYRPRAFGLTQKERCKAPSFRPRGFGNLFSRSASCYRIDYHRYVVYDRGTDYGPSYFANQRDPRCPTCDCGLCHRCRCLKCIFNRQKDPFHRCRECCDD